MHALKIRLSHLSHEFASDFTALVSECIGGGEALVVHATICVGILLLGLIAHSGHDVPAKTIRVTGDWSQLPPTAESMESDTRLSEEV